MDINRGLMLESKERLGAEAERRLGLCANNSALELRLGTEYRRKLSPIGVGSSLNGVGEPVGVMLGVASDMGHASSCRGSGAGGPRSAARADLPDRVRSFTQTSDCPGGLSADADGHRRTAIGAGLFGRLRRELGDQLGHGFRAFCLIASPNSFSPSKDMGASCWDCRAIGGRLRWAVRSDGRIRPGTITLRR
jgi:hypothetical protein